MTDEQRASVEKINDYLKMVDEIEKEHRNFEDLDIEMVVDFELMENITREFVTNSDVDLRARSLEELEFLVHQVDNAADFVKIGGLEIMLNAALAEKNEEIRARAFSVIAAAAQGNSAVQIEILKTNGISSILEVLANEDNSDLIRAKSIYALSASIRAFPAAQAEFVAKNGLGALKKAVHIRHLAKSVITLSSDLVREEFEAFAHRDDTNVTEERAKQYENNAISRNFKDINWCDDIKLGFKIENGHHTVVSAILELIFDLKCPTSPIEKEIREEVARYKPLCEEEENETDSDEFFCNILAKLESYITTRDEL